MTDARVAIPAEDKLDFKRVLPIFIIVLVDLLGLTIIIPLLPYYAASFGADPVTIGLLGSTYPMMQLIASPVLGGLSDRFGRKPILIAAAANFVGVGRQQGVLGLGAVGGDGGVESSRAIVHVDIEACVIGCGGAGRAGQPGRWRHRLLPRDRLGGGKSLRRSEYQPADAGRYSLVRHARRRQPEPHRR